MTSLETKSNIFQCKKETVRQVKEYARLLSLFIKVNSFLIEAYILDYFVSDLWSALPLKWREIVGNFSVHDLEKFLDPHEKFQYHKPWPLQLLAFRASAFALPLPRNSIQSLEAIREFLRQNFVRRECETFENHSCDLSAPEFDVKSGQHRMIPDYCRKHVKPKKQHEIFRMAQLTDMVMQHLGLNHAIDLGSGQGHLSRLLSLCFKHKLATIEANQLNVEGAMLFDQQALCSINKKAPKTTPNSKALHTTSNSKASQTTPNLKASQTTPNSKALHTTSNSKALQTTPNSKPLETTPNSQAIQDHIESFTNKKISQTIPFNTESSTCNNPQTTTTDQNTPHHNEPYKKNIQTRTQSIPYHIESSIDVLSSTRCLDSALSNMDLQGSDFALLGLHICGNLSETALKSFLKHSDARALLTVGCCYMKLEQDKSAAFDGFPLSAHCKSLPVSRLSYEARELSCHAIEMYRRRLRDNVPHLKIHCYRAALEVCITHHHPEIRHLGLRGVKHAERLPFAEYAEKALKKVSLAVPREFCESQQIREYLDRWKEVLVFYTLRLMTAPVIESLLLVDRLLFLYEQGCPGCVVPIFDPVLSPRNLVVISAK